MRAAFTLMILLLFYSCTESQKRISFSDEIHFRKESCQELSSIIDTVSYIPLEVNDNSFLSHLDKIIFCNGMIFIGDFGENKIVVFDDEGKFLYTIHDRGRAKNEYYEIKNFCVSNDELLYLIDNVKRELKCYSSKNGSFLKNIKLPISAWDVAVLDNGDFMFAFSPLENGRLKFEQPKYRLMTTGNDLKIKHQFFEYNNDEHDIIGKHSYFSENEKGLIFHWCGSDEIVFYDKVIDSLKVIRVDFGTEGVHWNKINEDRTFENIIGYYMYETPILCGDYIIMDVVDSDNSECFVYSIKGKVLYKNNVDDPLYMPFPMALDNNENLVYPLEGENFYYSLIHEGFPRASESIEQHLSKGIVLLKYKLKN